MREPKPTAARRRGPHRLALVASLALVLVLGAIAGDFAHRARLRGLAPPDPARWQLVIGEYARTMIDAFSLSLEPGLYEGRLALTLHTEARPLGLETPLQLPVRVETAVEFGFGGLLTLWLPPADGDTPRYLVFDPRTPDESGLFRAGDGRGVPIECARAPFPPPPEDPFARREIVVEVARAHALVRVDGGVWLDCPLESTPLGSPYLKAGASEIYVDHLRVRTGLDGRLVLDEDFTPPFDDDLHARMALLVGAVALALLWALERRTLLSLAREPRPAVGPALAASFLPLAILAVDPPHLIEVIRLESNIVKNTTDEVWAWIAGLGVVLLQLGSFLSVAPRFRARPVAPATGTVIAGLALFVAIAVGLARLTWLHGIDPLFLKVDLRPGWAVGVAAAYLALRLAGAALLARVTRLPTTRWIAMIAASDAVVGLALGAVLWVERGVDIHAGPNPWRANDWGWVCAAGGVAAVLRLLQLAANGARVRGANLLMLVALACVAGYAEGALRTTYLNNYWFSYFYGGYQQDDIFGWTRRDLGAIAEGDFVGSPDKAAPAVDELAAERIVCLGGSTTDMGENAYTVFLQEGLDERYGESRYSVVNLGVGGWGTYRIARYVESYVHRLQPSILILYVSYNDASFMGVPYTMKEVAERVSSRSDAASKALRILERSRLFVGYKKVLLAAAGQTFEDRNAVAVPPEDQRENLETVVRVASELGARVLLVSEAVAAADDRPRLAPYGPVMSGIAGAHEDVAYASAQEWFDATHRSDLFEDLVHPTERGARLLAARMLELLEERGWVGAPRPARESR